MRPRRLRSAAACADLAPGFVAAALGDRGLDTQQLLLERLLLGGSGANRGQHAVRLGGTARSEPGARGEQAEFDAVGWRSLRRQSLVQCGGTGVVAATHGLVGAIDGRLAARVVVGQPASSRTAASMTVDPGFDAKLFRQSCVE